ncbi:uncharacterized protein G2W53_010344 [Senna tora]|uniref:Uncharacterized protein n=1 Tax=Senna tora TaxID=362788 RepID=A0A835CBF8_9FABA|nr:uncharacterized protein G2W53_010344 [Senna tora]
MLELESSWHGRSVNHVLIYFGREIVVGSHKHSLSTCQKSCCANDLNRSVRVVFVKPSGFDARIGVVMHWNESDLKNDHEVRVKYLVAQVSETDRFALYLRNRVDLMLELESSWHGRIVNQVLIYFTREIVVGSHKHSRSMSQKSCCSNDLNRSVRVVFAKPCAFDARNRVVMHWKERESCLNIFWMRNRVRI